MHTRRLIGTSGRPGIGRRMLPAIGALALLGCTPVLGNDPPPDFMEFDTDTGRVPSPNIVAVNQETELIDMSILGIEVPDDCLAQAELEVAECEFYQYLESLDGFPTMSGLTAPVSAPLDLASVTFDGAPGDTLVVLDTNRMRKLTDVEVSFDDATNVLEISHSDGWDVDDLYVVAVRGYDDGVVTIDGNRVVASVIYNLLKREESLLNCRLDDPLPDPADLEEPVVVDHECKYFLLLQEMFAPDYPDPAELEQAAEHTLVDLETLRQNFSDDPILGLWAVTDTVGGMPKDEIAVVWAFPTHTASVAELNPDTDVVPQVTGNTRVRIPVKGTVDASTLIASRGYADPYLWGATVILLDVTVLQDCDNQWACMQAFPDFEVGFVDGAVEMSLDATPLVSGHQYVVALVTSDDPTARLGITNDGGQPIVPCPGEVALRARGPILVQGESVISSFSAQQAADLESARQDLAELLQDNGFLMDAGDLERDNIAYVYGFDHTGP